MIRTTTPWLLATLASGAVIALASGCSLEDESPAVSGPMGGGALPGTGGTAGTGATPGAGGAGADTGTGAAMGSGATGTGGTTDECGGCMGGKICLEGSCQCPPYAPDECAGTCVDLTEDHDFCGNCETACDATAACGDSMCSTPPTEIYAGTGCGTLSLEIHDGVLYFTESDLGTVKSLVPGMDAMELGTGLGTPGPIDVDASGIYVVDSSANKVLSLPLGGGSSSELSAQPTAVLDLAVDTGFVYFTQGEDVLQVPTGGGTPMVVATAQDGGTPGSVVVSGDWVVWAADIARNVERDTIEGDAVDYLGRSQGGLQFGHNKIAVQDDSVYWIDNGEVRVSPVETAMQTTVASASGGFDPITGFALNATHVYFVSSGTVDKAPIAGGDAIPIARAQENTGSVVVDDSSVYWVAGCSIMQAPL